MHSIWKNVLLEILKIIDYQGDKETFINTLEKQNYQLSLLNMIERLPSHLQSILKNTSLLTDEMRTYINEDVYQNELDTITYVSLSEFAQSIAHTLNRDQIRKINQLIASISS